MMTAWKVAEVAAVWTKTMATFVLLHRLLVAKSAQGISRKTQEILLIVYLLRYGHLEQFFFKDFQFHGWNAYGSLLSLFLVLSTLCAISVLSPWFQHPVYITYRRDQDDFPHWLFLLIPSLCLGVDRWLSHENPQMVFQDTASILESFALLPQIQMYRKYKHVESFTSGFYIFLIGLHHTIGSVFWMYAGYMYPGGISNIRLNCLTQTAMVLFCVLGTLSFENETETAPFRPHLKKFIADVCSVKFVIATALVFALESRVTAPAITKGEKAAVTVGTMAACFLLLCVTLHHCFVVRRRQKNTKRTKSSKSGSGDGESHPLMQDEGDDNDSSDSDSDDDKEDTLFNEKVKEVKKKMLSKKGKKKKKKAIQSV